MRKQLRSTLNEKGFILPSVLFLTSIVFVYFSSGLITYSHDIHLTHNMMEQVKSQSIFQMAYAKYKNDYLPHNNLEENVAYSFPIGNAKIKTTITEEVIRLEFDIETDNNFTYTVTKLSKTYLDDEKGF